jgi:hypothetical protein
VGRGAFEQLDAAKSLAFDAGRRFLYARIVALGQDNPQFRAPRPLVHAFQKRVVSG